MIRALTGRTYTFTFDFFDEDTGIRTVVDSPTADFFTPERTTWMLGVGLSPDLSFVGRYDVDLELTAGLTVGQWFALGCGLTQGTTLFSQAVPFEIIDMATAPLWISLDDLRTHLGITDENDHSNDRLHRNMLQAAAGLVEDYTGAFFGLRAVSEMLEIKSTDRITLRHYPVHRITGMTPTVQIIPRGPNNLVAESVTGNSVSFHFRLTEHNGLMTLTDSAGFEQIYDGVLLSIDYLAGLAVIPAGIKTATLMLASKLINMQCNEGITTLRLSDVSFAIENKLFEGAIAEALSPYVHRSFK